MFYRVLLLICYTMMLQIYKKFPKLHTEILTIFLLNGHRLTPMVLLLYSPKMAVGANRNYFPAFNIILGDGDKF